MIITIIIIAFIVGVVTGVLWGKYLLLWALRSKRGDSKQFGGYIRYTGMQSGKQSVILESREKAEEVLSKLIDLINTYREASVSDLKNLINVRSEPDDLRYGWMDLNAAFVTRTYDRYMLKLPEAVILDAEVPTNA